MLVGDVHQSEDRKSLGGYNDTRESESSHAYRGKTALDHLICLGLGVLYTAADYLIYKDDQQT